MNITFGANFTIKSNNFFLPQDTPADREHINAVLKKFSEVLSLPKVDAVLKNDKIELSRRKSVNKFALTIKHASSTMPNKLKDAQPVILEYISAKDFNAFDCFEQLSYLVASKVLEISNKLPLGTDMFKYILEHLYKVRFK